ncbi:hypothetical protein N431DRAFT_380850 [Stipitochalara longipes BDJ]|nr:hypothetical protein N431DRAFT_380850 [Stipitochalara longipes BDJ]
MPPICRFWQQGTCRNGNNCRFEHPGAGSSRDPPNTNRFAPLQNSDNSRSSNGYRAQPSATAAPPYGLEKAAIIIDLSSEKPQWILSAYGPGRGAPAQLFGGPQREQSFEELRLLHYIGVGSGNTQPAVQEAERIYQAADQQMQTALNDVDGAINYIIRAENDHPNRIDICKESQAASAGSQRGVFQRTQEYPVETRSQPAISPAFGAPAQPGAFGQPTGGAFGQSSTLGQKPNPFGAPSGAFGQPSGGAFGQPSALGQKPNPFGAPAPAFGAPTQLGGGGAFGQPSALGQKPSPFGAPSGAFSQPSGGAFGQPSALGQQPNPFGGQPPAPAPFGAPSQPQVNPIGAPSGQNPNPFGAVNPISQSNPLGATPAPFGAPSPAPKNPFGAPSQPAPNPFGGTPIPQPNPFGAAPGPAPAAASPFGTPQPPSQPAANPFGNPQSTPRPAATPFGNPPPAQPQTQPYTNGSSSLTEHPPLSKYSTRDSNGHLLTWKGKHVVYKDGLPGTQSFDGTWEKIWFPDGPPAPDKWAEAEPELYTEDVKNAYEHARRNGVFDGGMIPLVPPKQEWCQWDF